MLLAHIRDEAAKFGEVISKTLGVDVLIVDNDLKTISNSYRYFNKYDLIKRTSVIGTVISSGKVVALSDKNDFAVCRDCSDFATCEMSGFIGVPIFYNDCVVGAISLVLPRQRIPEIFKEVQSSILFLQRMADLLASKIRDHDEYTCLNIIRREREMLIDSIDDALVSTDHLGYITYHNKPFQRLFCQDESAVGTMLGSLVQHPLVAKVLHKQQALQNELLLAQVEKGEPFYGLASSRQIAVNGTCTGMLFTFKPVQRINREMQTMAAASTVDFAHCEERYFSKQMAGEAKRAALEDGPLLLNSPKGAPVELMARCLHSFSKRSGNAMGEVDCRGGNGAQLEEEIFGELGKLHLAHKSSLFFRDIDQLPVFLQQRLEQFLRDKQLVSASHLPIPLDVRLIFSASRSLEQLTAKGMFCERLYYRLALNSLDLPALQRERGFFKDQLAATIAFYTEGYGKPELCFTPQAMESLCQRAWLGQQEELEWVVDKLVYLADAVVDDALVEQVAAGWETTNDTGTIQDFERARLEDLLSKNIGKEEIARVLGISRATLYRKIKNYQFEKETGT